MKLASEIKAAVQEQVGYDLDISNFVGWEEVESIIAAKLEPVRVALKAIQDMHCVSGLHEGDLVDRALALFEEAE